MAVDLTNRGSEGTWQRDEWHRCWHCAGSAVVISLISRFG